MGKASRGKRDREVISVEALPARERPRGQVGFQATRTAIFAGPLPHPDVLAAYERVVPGLGERIVAMTEAQSKHRQDIETKVLGGNVDAQRRGQWFAFILGIVALGAGVWLIYTGKPAAGVTLMSVEAFGLAGVFVTGKWIQYKERRERRDPPARSN